MYHQSIYYQSIWCLRLCAHPNLPGAGALRSKIFAGYDIPSAISVVQRLICTLFLSDREDCRLPFLPVHGQVVSLPRQTKYIKDVTTAGAHPQDKCTPDYLRTQKQSEQAKLEIHLAPFPADGSLPTSWDCRTPCQPLPRRPPPPPNTHRLSRLQPAYL